MAAPQLELQNIVDYEHAISRDIATMQETHEQLLHQIEDLASQVIDPLTGAVKALPTVCEKLEAAFQRIDELNAYLDRIHGDLVAQHRTIRGILDAPTMTEKAGAFFAKFSKPNPRESGVWKRVPETIVVGGSTLDTFMEDFHHSIESVKAAAAALKKH